MRKIFLLITTLVAAFLFAGCSSPASSSGDTAYNKELELPHSESEWLFVLYMDADNNLNDTLWVDLYNVQSALSDMMNYDGTPKNGYPSVKIVALWDGVINHGLENQYINHSQAEIYELGPMEFTDQTRNLFYIEEETLQMSRWSKNLTKYAPWLPYEPDMGDKSTLVNFLSWVHRHYSANKTVLLLGNHGAGTEFETSSGGYNNYSWAPEALQRSMCSDYTNGTGKLLTATDIKKSIEKSGLQPDIIYMDCCLQGNVETAYILKGTTDYLVTSANISQPNNLEQMLLYINSYNTPKDFARLIVKTYANRMYNRNITYAENENISCTSFYKAATYAVYDLNEDLQKQLYEAIDKLAIKLRFESNNLFYKYIKQDPYSYSNCKGMTFPGTYLVLSDIGYFCMNIRNDNTVNYGTKSLAEEVISLLDKIIITSWIGRKDEYSNHIFYAKNVPELYIAENSDVFNEHDGQFGLTIVTQTFYNNDKYNDTDLLTLYSYATGYSSNWGDLICYWNGIDSNNHIYANP